MREIVRGRDLRAHPSVRTSRVLPEPEIRHLARQVGVRRNSSSVALFFSDRRIVITMSGDQAGNPDPWAAWPARAEPLAPGDPIPQAARGPQGAAGRGRCGQTPTALTL